MRAALTLACLLCWPGLAPGQERKPPAPEDYGRWEELGPSKLSPDGRWLVYSVRRVDGENTLRTYSVEAGTTLTAPFGEEPAFSENSRFLAYRIASHEDEAARLRKEGKPVHHDMGLLDLAQGTTEVVEGVRHFAFSADGRFLAILRYPPEAPEAETLPEADDESRPGADLQVRDLESGKDAHFGNVSEIAWNDEVSFLAMIIETGPDGSTNAVQIYDPANRRLEVLDSSAASYRVLAWREEADDLAVLRTLHDDRYEKDNHRVLVWTGLASESPELHQLDPSLPAAGLEGRRIASYRGLEFSEDGARLFFGVQPWERKPEGEEATVRSENGAPAEEGNEDEEEDSERDEEEVADVEVWHAGDERVIPEQKLTARRDRRESTLASWHLGSEALVDLADERIRDVFPVGSGELAMGLDTTPYAFEGMFGRERRDVYRVDTESGEREKILEGLVGGRRFGDDWLQSSPEGKYLLYWKDDHYWSYELESGTTRNLTEPIATSFVDREDDHPALQKPPHGIAGWVEGDETVLLHDALDLWMVALDGSDHRKLTEGGADAIRHRYLDLDPDADHIDPEAPMYLSLYGEWSKKTGFARIASLAKESPAERLLWRDQRVDRLQRAKAAEVFAFVAQDFTDSPDVFLATGSVAEARAVTETNPFQSDYQWGRAELIDYENRHGKHLQGALIYPAGYVAGRRYPMLVYVYEKRSQRIHDYHVPTERRPYNPTVFSSQGYFVLQPDIVFEAREPGASALDCITAAVEKVLERGEVDPERLGLVGHSWGGYETSFVSTNSNLFAAAVAGAPLNNFFSMYGSVFWNTGVPETGHFEVGQERMEVPFWEDVDAYVRNSPIFAIEKLETPLLMAFGDADGSVDWHQGIEMYNAARRAGKDFVLLVYPGENHSLRRKPNQIDYHRRILEWFGHYLKGAPAPAWITDGVTHLESEKSKKKEKESS